MLPHSKRRPTNCVGLTALLQPAKASWPNTNRGISTDSVLQNLARKAPPRTIKRTLRQVFLASCSASGCLSDNIELHSTYGLSLALGKATAVSCSSLTPHTLLWQAELDIASAALCPSARAPVSRTRISPKHGRSSHGFHAIHGEIEMFSMPLPCYSTQREQKS